LSPVVINLPRTVEYSKTENSEDVDVVRSGKNTVTVTDMDATATTVEYPKNENPETVDLSDTSAVVKKDDMNDNDTPSEDVKSQDSEDVNVDRSASNTDVSSTAIVNVVPMDPERAEKARDAASIGYMEGYKEGHKDGKHGHTYKDTARYYRGPDETTIMPSHKYKPFYEQGYKMGYEDGYNNTTKYGEVTDYGGGKKGYSVYSTTMDSLVGVSD